MRLHFFNIGIIFMIILIFINLLWTLYLLNFTGCFSKLPWNSTKTQLPEIAPTTVAHIKMTADKKYSYYIKSTSFAHTIEPDILAFDNVKFNLGRWDNRRQYKMYDNALVGDTFIETSNNSLVCLATQGSVERLHSLVQVAQKWNGPMSVAAFVADDEEFSILQYYVTYLRLCFAFVRNNLTFHLLVPYDKEPRHRLNADESTGKFDCRHPEKTLRWLLYMRSVSSKRWRYKNEYPQNHMRNLARKGCQSKYVFLTDVDIIPSRNMAVLLNAFLQNVKCTTPNRCAYVIPTFEVDVRVKLPATKNEVIRLFKKGLVRPFHEKVLIYNQYATNFSSWMSTKMGSDTEIAISHKVTNFEFLYEPFYVALDNAPAHDERFIGYGFTRNSQVYEMYIAGYTFYVLSPVFTCHWGLQLKRSRPAWREQQNNVNRKRFEIFKKEIYVRYRNETLCKKKI